MRGVHEAAERRVSIEAWRVATIAGALSVVVGCASGATIVRSPANGGPVYGTIVGNGERTLYLRTGSGEEVGIPHEQIEDIDHPGNVLAVVGAAVLVYGAYNLWVGIPKCDSEGTAFCVGVFLPAPTGIALTLWGVNTYTDSRDAARGWSPRSRTTAIMFSPLLQPASEAKALGLNVAGRF